MVYWVVEAARSRSTSDGFAIEHGGWNNSYQVQIIPFIANAFSIFLFAQYYTVDPEVAGRGGEDRRGGWFADLSLGDLAARRARRSRPSAILTFLPQWNSYLWPLLVIQDEELRPVQVGMQLLLPTGTAEPPWGQIMAYTTMITIPVVVVFLSLPAGLRLLGRLRGGQGLSPATVAPTLPHPPGDLLVRRAHAAHLPLHARPQLDERPQRARLVRRRVPPVLPAQPARQRLGQHVLGARGQPRPRRWEELPVAIWSTATRGRLLRQRRGRPRQHHRPRQPGNPAMVAVYTSADLVTGRQVQSVAWSTDRGRTLDPLPREPGDRYRTHRLP